MGPKGDGYPMAATHGLNGCWFLAWGRRSFALCGVLTLLAWLVAACPGPDRESADLGIQEQGIPVATHCNPISGDHCFLPWPSSFYLKKDSTSATGYRLNYAEKAMPATVAGKPLSVTRFNTLDGFSPASQILVFVKKGFGKDGFPGQEAIASSTLDTSLIQVLEMGTGARVPFWAELDANGKSDEVPGLIIRPAAPLKWNTRYVVVLRQGLKDAAGGALTAPSNFQKLASGKTGADPTLAAEAARLKDMFVFLEKQKMPAKDLVLAWDFHTASQAGVQSNLVNMLQTAWVQMPAGGPPFTITKVEEQSAQSEQHLMRVVHGTFQVPSFLESDSADAWLKLDALGRPQFRGAQSFAFRINIPRCAATATKPLPILFYGLGLFATLDEEMGDASMRSLAQKLCMVQVSTPWIGLSGDDLAAVIDQVVGKDFSNLPRITDRLQQAQVNMHMLVRLMMGSILKDSAMMQNSKAISDGVERYYLGISNGGIQGVAFAALNKDITTYALNVAGGLWSLMMQRSSNFASLSLMLAVKYPSALDRLILTSLSQHHWDFTDPATFAQNLVKSPLQGQPLKRVLLQEAKDDDQVPNLGTRYLARAAGLPLLTPYIDAVFGLTTQGQPLDSAYVQWNTYPSVKPATTNTPAPKAQASDSAHNNLRKLEPCIRQWTLLFVPGGKIYNTCDGACDPL